MNTICLAICTYGRTSKVLDCINKSLFEYDSFSEKILIDNNPTPNSDFKVLTQLGFEIYHCPDVGLSHARNMALKKSKADYVWFIDDDASLRPGFAKAIIKLKESNNKIGFAGGPILPAFDDPASARYLGPMELSLLSCAIDTDSNFQPWGANMAIHRETSINVGAFNPFLGYRGENTAILGEEDDLFSRIKQSNEYFMPLILKDASVDHWIPNTRLSYRWLLKRSYNGGKTFFQVYKRASISLFLKRFILLIAKPNINSLLKFTYELGIMKSKIDAFLKKSEYK